MQFGGQTYSYFPISFLPITDCFVFFQKIGFQQKCHFARQLNYNKWGRDLHEAVIFKDLHEIDR